MVQVVFDGRMPVSYSQAYLASGEAQPTWDDAFTGQVNGLLGAALPGALTLAVGVHTGDVGMRVVLAERAPDVGTQWEDVVEVSFVPAGSEVGLAGCMSDEVCTFVLDLADYRVRLSARGMDAGRAADVVMDEEPLVDFYELAFWPAESAPDAVLRQGSESAAFRHMQQDPDKARAAAIHARWGDAPSSERLVDIFAAPWLVERDRGLAEALAAAQPGVQRAMAHWAAQRACAEAGIEQLEWVAAGLAALHRGEALPEPFDDPGAMYDRLEADLAARRPTVSGGPPGMYQGGQALFAIPQAVYPDPLDAAVCTLCATADVHGDDRTAALLVEARSALQHLAAEAVARHGDGPVPDTRVPVVEEDGDADPPEGMDAWNFWHQTQLWGPQLPSARLMQVGAWELGKENRPLAEALAAAEPDTQRAVARWAARRACEGAGLTDIAEVAAALDAIDRGEALAAPFDTQGAEWALIDDDKRVGDHIIVFNGLPNCSRWHFALPVLHQAVEADELLAATRSLWTAACSFGDDSRLDILDEAQTHFHLHD